MSDARIVGPDGVPTGALDPDFPQADNADGEEHTDGLEALRKDDLIDIALDEGLEGIGSKPQLIEAIRESRAPVAETVTEA